MSEKKWYQKNSPLTIVIMLVAIAFLVVCICLSMSMWNQTSEDVASSEVTKNSSLISSDKDITKEKVTTYQSILDEFSKKLKTATPKLVKEYKQEASKNSNGITGLAEISNNKIQELAKISTDGIEEMAKLMYSSGSGSYSEYEKWAGKLQDVYTKQAGKITAAYMDSVK